MNVIKDFYDSILSYEHDKKAVLKYVQKRINFKSGVVFLFLFTVFVFAKPFFINVIAAYSVIEISFFTAIIYTLVGWVYFSYLYKTNYMERFTVKKDLFHFFKVTVLASLIYLIFYHFVICEISKKEMLKNGLELNHTFYVRLFLWTLFFSSSAFVILRHLDFAEIIKYHNLPHVKLKKEEFAKNTSFKENIKDEKNFLSLMGKNKDENVVVHTDDFFYLESLGHYAKAYIKLENEIKTVIFRNSIANVIQQMELHDCLYQCHRSFLINKNKIISIEGNSNKAFLYIEGINAKIPVSRESYAALKRKTT